MQYRVIIFFRGSSTFEPQHGKTSNLHNAKTKAQISFAVIVWLITARLITVRAFVFTKQIVQFLYLLNPKFPVSSHLLCLYSSVYVGPVRKPHCWFSHDTAHLCSVMSALVIYGYMYMKYFHDFCLWIKVPVNIFTLMLEWSHSSIGEFICLAQRHNPAPNNSSLQCLHTKRPVNKQ